MKFSFLRWNGVAKKIMNEENTLHYYRVVNEDNISVKNLKKFTESVNKWAKYAHENDLFYQVTALQNPEEPFANIIFNKEYIIVEFLDEKNRKYMSYAFHKTKGMLFIVKLHFWVFVGEGDEYDANVIKDVICQFTTEGSLKVITKTKIEGTDKWNVEEKQAAHKINVEKNWEPFPQFGKYEGLVVLKRWHEGDFLKDVFPENLN